jgi:hypothetical protein
MWMVRFWLVQYFALAPPMAQLSVGRRLDSALSALDSARRTSSR